MLQVDTGLRHRRPAPPGPRQVCARAPLPDGACRAAPSPAPLCACPYLASRARAMMPAARGAEADVPVCDSVHFCLRSVVTCQEECRGRRCCGHWPRPGAGSGACVPTRAAGGEAEPPLLGQLTSFPPEALNSRDRALGATQRAAAWQSRASPAPSTAAAQLPEGCPRQPQLTARPTPVSPWPADTNSPDSRSASRSGCRCCRWWRGWRSRPRCTRARYHIAWCC